MNHMHAKDLLEKMRHHEKILQALASTQQPSANLVLENFQYRKNIIAERINSPSGLTGDDIGELLLLIPSSKDIDNTSFVQTTEYLESAKLISDIVYEVTAKL